MRTGVVIATMGRPAAVTQVLRLLERQTMRPATVVLSATSQTDVESGVSTTLPVECIFGSAGTCIQRNRGLNRIRSRCDVVIFFDDDFAPSASWIEACARLFESRPDVAGASGILLRDGAQTQEIPWPEAIRLVDSPQASPPSDSPPSVSECKDLYGCNMAFRMSSIGDASFDERLVLYGWMEDKDFSRMIAKRGRLAQSSSMVGVHLGIKSGRMPGKRYGYSQVVNPWYLHKKGMMSTAEAWSTSWRPFLMNGAKALRPEKHIDRLGRLGGNIIGLAHLLVGRCRPEAAADL